MPGGATSPMVRRHSLAVEDEGAEAPSDEHKSSNGDRYSRFKCRPGTARPGNSELTEKLPPPWGECGWLSPSPLGEGHSPPTLTLPHKGGGKLSAFLQLRFGR